MKKYEFEIKGITPVIMHKFNGLKEEKKIKNLSNEQQAKRHAYIDEATGKLYAPADWLKWCLINCYIDIAAEKKKQEAKRFAAPRIIVEPEKLFLDTDKYEIDVRSVPAGNVSRGGVRDFVVRPLIRNWQLKGTVISTLGMSTNEFGEFFARAGKEIGIGANRIAGYGRFAIISLKEIPIA